MINAGFEFDSRGMGGESGLCLCVWGWGAVSLSLSVSLKAFLLYMLDLVFRTFTSVKLGP